MAPLIFRLFRLLQLAKNPLLSNPSCRSSASGCSNFVFFYHLHLIQSLSLVVHAIVFIATLHFPYYDDFLCCTFRCIPLATFLSDASFTYTHNVSRSLLQTIHMIVDLWNHAQSIHFMWYSHTGQSIAIDSFNVFVPHPGTCKPEFLSAFFAPSERP